MPRKDYQAQLDALRTNVVEMSDLVLERYEQAIRAYETGDPDLANGVITRDHEVNKVYLSLEKDCTDLLALQQPVAGDLRFITASFKIITDLERIADLATNLARYGREMGGKPHPAIDHQTLADTAGDMVADAIEAYRVEDADACREIAARDDDLDAECEKMSENLVKGLIRDHEDEAEELIHHASHGLLTIRDLERVGDHAVNICARTLYMIENDDELIY